LELEVMFSDGSESFLLGARGNGKVGKEPWTYPERI
jgi:hypothetical protein